MVQPDPSPGACLLARSYLSPPALQRATPHKSQLPMPSARPPARQPVCSGARRSAGLGRGFLRVWVRGPPTSPAVAAREVTGQAGLVSPQGGWPLWRTGACLLWTTECPPARQPAPGEPWGSRWCQCSPARFESWLGDPRLANLYQQLDPNCLAYHTSLSRECVVLVSPPWVARRCARIGVLASVLHLASCFASCS